MNRISTFTVLCVLALAGAARAQQTDQKPDQKTTRTPRTAPNTRPVVKPTAPAAPTTTTAPAPAKDAKPAADAKPADRGAPAADTKPGDANAGRGGATGGDAPEAGDSDGELYKCKKFPENARIKVTLKPETEFKELVTWAMGFTCKNFIFGTGISGRSGKVTVIAPTDMSPRDAWRLFLVALQTMGLTVVEKGRTLEIIEMQRAKESPVGVYKPGNAPTGDQIVRVLMRPEYMSVEDLAAVLGSLKSANGTIQPLPNAGVVMVTDMGSSIDKMVDVMRQIDEPTGAEKIYIVRVQYADATELATKLGEIFGIGQSGGKATNVAPATRTPRRERGAAGGKDTAPQAAPAGGSGTDSGAAMPSKIIPDERTNSLIIISSERGYARILALIKRLDVAVEGGEGRIHVLYLSHADAEELSNTLNGITTGTQGAGARGGARGGQQGGQGGGAAAGGGGTAVFEGNVKVTFDKPTNSLIIVSSVKDFLSLREVLRKLDIPRRQVFVEATILEVSLDKTRAMGVAAHGGLPLGSGDTQSLLFGGVEHQNQGLTSLSLPELNGLLGGVFGPELTGSAEFLGVSIPSFGIMFQLLQSNNDVNILSSPHLLTLDNEPAEISIGQNIPYQSAVSGLAGLAGLAGQAGADPTGGATGGLGGLGSLLGTQIQRQNVALKMKLTPHISESEDIRFELEQEISDIASPNFAGLGPSWSTRTVKTMIVVRDQQPVVIGGLMSDKITVRESKVPLLGDIPIIGYFFKRTEKQKVKTNLLIVITPYIIHDQTDLKRIFDKKMRERREFIETFTTFDPDIAEMEIDYTRKRGFLESINQSVRMADEDDRMAAEAEEAMRRYEDEGPVEMPDEFRGGGDTSVTPAPAPPPQPRTPKEPQ